MEKLNHDVSRQKNFKLKGQRENADCSVQNPVTVGRRNPKNSATQTKAWMKQRRSASSRTSTLDNKKWISQQIHSTKTENIRRLFYRYWPHVFEKHPLCFHSFILSPNLLILIRAWRSPRADRDFCLHQSDYHWSTFTQTITLIID